MPKDTSKLPKMPPRYIQDTLSCLQATSKIPQDASKIPPRYLQYTSKMTQAAPKCVQDISKMPQDASKMPLDASKMGQDASKTPQDSPRCLQEAPRCSKMATKTMKNQQIFIVFFYVFLILSLFFKVSISLEESLKNNRFGTSKITKKTFKSS